MTDFNKDIMMPQKLWTDSSTTFYWNNSSSTIGNGKPWRLKQIHIQKNTLDMMFIVSTATKASSPIILFEVNHTNPKPKNNTTKQGKYTTFCCPAKKVGSQKILPQLSIRLHIRFQIKEHSTKNNHTTEDGFRAISYCTKSQKHNKSKLLKPTKQTKEK